MIVVFSRDGLALKGQVATNPAPAWCAWAVEKKGLEQSEVAGIMAMTRSMQPVEFSSRPAKRKVLEDGRERAEPHLLREMNRYLKVNLSDPYDVVLNTPLSPARAVIRSNHLLLVSVPTLRRFSSGSGLLTLLG